MTTNKEIIKLELKELRGTGSFSLYDVAISEKKLTPEQIKQVDKIEGFKEYKKKSVDYSSTRKSAKRYAKLFDDSANLKLTRNEQT